MRMAKTLIKLLRWRAGWSESSLDAHAVLYKMVCPDSEEMFRYDAFYPGVAAYFFHTRDFTEIESQDGNK